MAWHISYIIRMQRLGRGESEYTLSFEENVASIAHAGFQVWGREVGHVDHLRLRQLRTCRFTELFLVRTNKYGVQERKSCSCRVYQGKQKEEMP